MQTTEEIINPEESPKCAKLSAAKACIFDSPKTVEEWPLKILIYKTLAQIGKRLMVSGSIDDHYKNITAAIEYCQLTDIECRTTLENNGNYIALSIATLDTMLTTFLDHNSKVSAKKKALIKYAIDAVRKITANSALYIKIISAIIVSIKEYMYHDENAEVSEGEFAIMIVGSIFLATITQTDVRNRLIKFFSPNTKLENPLLKAANASSDFLTTYLMIISLVNFIYGLFGIMEKTAHDTNAPGSAPLDYQSYNNSIAWGKHGIALAIGILPWLSAFTSTYVVQPLTANDGIGQSIFGTIMSMIPVAIFGYALSAPIVAGAFASQSSGHAIAQFSWEILLCVSVIVSNLVGFCVERNQRRNAANKNQITYVALLSPAENDDNDDDNALYSIQNA